MALYTIGDLHLSTGADKPMDVFGGNWENYIEKLNVGLSVLEDRDICVICGDISWGMSMEEAAGDFKFIDKFRGKKIILKGNHDYWWSTASKAKKFFTENDITTIDILHNNCFFYEDIAICGTRGWFCDRVSGTQHDHKIMSREIMRLETSLKQAGERSKIVFLHYPPIYNTYVCEEIIKLFEKYDVKKCFYGHIHGPGHKCAVEGFISGVEYTMVSADYLNFSPLKVM